jgi:hypothetical protein
VKLVAELDDLIKWIPEGSNLLTANRHRLYISSAKLEWCRHEYKKQQNIVRNI